MHVLLMILVAQAQAYSSISVATSTVMHPQMTVSAVAKSPISAILSSEAALEKCKARGGVGCQTFSVEKACMAVASNDEFASFFHAESDAQVGAQKAALEECRQKSGNSHCTLRTSVCDFPVCKKSDDYDACVRHGDAMFPGSGKEFCHSQFC